MPRFFGIVGLLGALFIGGLTFDYIRAPRVADRENELGELSAVQKEKTLEERVAEAKQKSENRKGVYVTYGVAADEGAGATRLRNSLFTLLDETELDAVVIDVKEAGGTMLSDGLRKTVNKLREKDVWTIARMTMFRDNSQIAEHPHWYIKRKNGAFWRDRGGNAWLDPSNSDVWDYQLREAKKAIDYGFDEIQFDYVRFPSDGDMNDIVYPTYESQTAKYEIIKNFVAFMNRGLKTKKPEIILSADLFGYVAIQTEDLNIGQRLVDIADSVDYISFMVYPSHYYAGFYISADKERNIPSLYLPYKHASTSLVVSNNPYPVIYRSMLNAGDTLTKKIVATSTNADGTIATTTTIKKHSVRMRPFLQDFNLGVDTARGIYYDAAKVRAEIQAAEDAGTSGWLLWNASNVYTKEALDKKRE